jgi:hypothetical protein
MEQDFVLFNLAMGFLVGEGQEQFVQGTSEEENAAIGPTLETKNSLERKE